MRNKIVKTATALALSVAFLSACSSHPTYKTGYQNALDDIARDEMVWKVKRRYTGYFNDEVKYIFSTDTLTINGAPMQCEPRSTWGSRSCKLTIDSPRGYIFYSALINHPIINHQRKSTTSGLISIRKAVISDDLLIEASSTSMRADYE